MKQVVDQRTVEIAGSCAALPDQQRKAFLDRECRGDAELRQRVESAIRRLTVSEPTQVLSNDYESALPDHYRLIEMLGRGGMAEVFLAEDSRLGRRVAIKFLNSEFRKDPERMRRFNQEARSASALNHPNILTIHDIGENNGVQFIVSEFVEGETLSARILRGRLPLNEAIKIAIQITSALSASHKAGIVHRDLKPDNVMIRRDGSVKVLDFGLAKETGNDLSNAPDSDALTLDRVLTSPGLILGTPQYMSPEQARGKPLDARTDIFSLGIILFEMVSGHPPFSGGSMADTIAAIVSKEPARLEEFMRDPPLGLVRIVQKALRKEKEERYVSMDHLLSDLRDLELELTEERSYGRETGRTQARATLHDTIRTVLSGKILLSRWLLVLPALIAAAAAIWWLFTLYPFTTTLTTGPLRSVAITSWSSGVREPISGASFSADAKMVAFAATRSDATEIFVKPTEGGDPVQVTKNGFYNQYPVWSPNDREIAFFSSRGNDHGIWKAAFTGGERIQIVGRLDGSARPVLWAKDGRIFFQEGPELFAVDDRTGERMQITDLASTGVKARTIQISDDTSTIAYSFKDADVWKLMIRRLDSLTANEVASSASQIDHIAWKPDGNTIVFSSSLDGVYQIFETSVGRESPAQLSNGNTDSFVRDVSADGSRILFGFVTESSDLWKVDTAKAEETLVANDVAAEFWPDVSAAGDIVYQSVDHVARPFGGSINLKSVDGESVLISPSGFAPVWSHDGRSVAFFRRAAAGMEIWRAGTSGDGAVRVAAGDISPPGYTAMPYLRFGMNHLSWSPDDKFLAYSARSGGISNIWLAAADGSRTIALTDNKSTADRYCCIQFGAGGSFVLFSSETPSIPGKTGPRYSLWEARTDVPGQNVLYESGERLRFLGLVESGKKAAIVQAADPSDTSPAPLIELKLISLTSKEQPRTTKLGNAYFDNIHLSPDGSSIAFVSPRDNETALWTVPVNGGTPRKLLSENDPKIMFSSLAWSPDGRSIVFGRQTRTNLLSMLAK